MRSYNLLLGVVFFSFVCFLFQVHNLPRPPSGARKNFRAPAFFRERTLAARHEALTACPSLNHTSRVGVDPGSLDVVITMVNFTTQEYSETRPNYLHLTIDQSEEHRCEPRATVLASEPGRPNVWEGRPNLHRCDHLSERSCCIKSHDNTTAPGVEWGTCVKPSPRNKYCRCRDCFDTRIRRRELQFNEVRMQLRSFEKMGLHLQSKAHPNGVLRKIFIVYNECNGNGAPTWLKEGLENVVAVPHSAIWNSPDGDEGLPSFNRNAIVNELHRIPDLQDWFLYLEDDLFLVHPSPDIHSANFLSDGRVKVRMSRCNLGDLGWNSPSTTSRRELPNVGGGGYYGSMWTTMHNQQAKFGRREKKTTSHVYPELIVGPRCAEGMHTAWMMKMPHGSHLEFISNEYVATSRRSVATGEDMNAIFHHGAYIEDMGFAANVNGDNDFRDDCSSR